MSTQGSGDVAGLRWGLNTAPAGPRARRTRARQGEHTRQLGCHKSVRMAGTGGLLLGCVALVPWLASGHNLRCGEAWSGPSKDNDMVECLSKYPAKEPGMLVPPAIAIVVLLAVAVTPLVFVCRLLGGCGSSKPRPGSGCCCGGSEWDCVPEAEKLIVYPRAYAFRIKLGAWLTLVTSVVVIGLFAAGGKVLTDTATGMLTSARVDVVDWARDLSTAVQQELMTSGAFVGGFSASTFLTVDDFLERLRVYVDSGREWNDSNSRWVFGGIVAAGCFLFVALLVPVVLACCNVRKCVPGCCSCGMALVGIVYGVLGVLGVAMGIAITSACGEMDLHRGAQPGVIQWLAVPLCDDASSIGKLEEQIAEGERNGANDACTEIEKLCSPAGIYNVADPEEVFVCAPPPAQDSATCIAAEAVSTYVRALEFKQGVAGVCVGCRTFADCFDRCAQGTLRDNVVRIEGLLTDAVRVLRALNRLAPLASCDALVTRALVPLRDCTDAAVGTLCVGVGAVLATLLCICAMIVLLKGSKVFFNREDMRKRAQELYAASPMVAHPMPQSDL